MASWLVLDWDQDQFHILHAQSSRGGVQVTRAATWAHPEPLTPSTSEGVGKALREFLKTQKIAAAPVIIGIGRDRIFLKELQIPPIAAHEEASLVRFQTGKEMAEPIDSYAVDYAYLSTESGGDRHIMTVAGRRELVGTSLALCQAAGLKLHALTPRLFGAAAAVQRALKPEPSPFASNRLNAVLTVGQRWAEMCFFRGDRLLQAQALANGPHLVAEVKRNLAVFQAQHAVDVEAAGPDRLYVLGAAGEVLESLIAGQPLPVAVLDPLKEEPAAAENRAAFAGAIGLAELWALGTPRPINLFAPKRERAPISVTRRTVLTGSAAAAVLAALVVGLMIYSLAAKRAEIARLTMHQNLTKNDLADVAQERADLDSYKEWEQGNIPWLDEIYDLSARYPFEVGFRVNTFTANSTGTKKSAKDPYTGNILLAGVSPKDKYQLVNDLFLSMARDAHLRPEIGRTNEPNYAMKIDVAKQEAKKYDTKLKVRPRQKAPGPPPLDESKLTLEGLKLAESNLPPEDKSVVAPNGADSEKGGAQ